MARSSSNPTSKPVPCEHACIQLDLSEPVMPLSLSIEVPGGRTERVIERGVRLPFHHTALYSTADAYQMAAEFHIVLGERPLARDNVDACRVRVRNVKWSGAGVPKIEIAFDIDKTGLITIGAANKDKKSTELLAAVEQPHISADVLAAAAADAVAHADEDARHREDIDTMLAGYYLLDQAYERYSIAKRRMGFGRKRAYKSVRGRLQKALEVMPPEATEATMVELRTALDAFRAMNDSLEEDYRKVMSWWNKK